VANQPGQQFNPLFLYGGVGLGKTHLLHAIGNLAHQNGFHTLYCSSEQFTNDLISAIRSQSTEEFRNKYRRVDILLIDDIQFIGGKESTQEEFFHTFNHLQSSGAQVILSSDRPPKALATLEERLRSRFEGGLQTDIAQPDFETRVAILQTKAKKIGVPVPQDVLMLVAERVDSNIRELEGALNQLHMHAQLSKATLNMSLAMTVLDNLAPSRTPCTPGTLIRIVAEYYGLTEADIVGRRRTKMIANARQVAMYLLRVENCLSLPAIGELVGGRDHTTVRYGVEQVTKRLAKDDALHQAVAQLRERVYTPYIG
jgi:chromosomal replication initiator protein